MALTLDDMFKLKQMIQVLDNSRKEVHTPVPQSKVNFEQLMLSNITKPNTASTVSGNKKCKLCGKDSNTDDICPRCRMRHAIQEVTNVRN